MQKKGIVYLIGAGPGDAQLITVKGLQRIIDADVIIYDRLVNPSLLHHAKSDAELMYVGKSPNQHAMSQEQINALLVRKANEGKSVVRLKGGDPFVFGRGGEEAETLSENNIPYEVIPGISSAIAAPAYAGIPVTHRRMASSFAVVTGHEREGKDKTSIQWEKLATGVDTLVFLMGVGNLPFIVEQLLREGRDEKEPVALVCWGTTPEQRTLVGNLGNIAEVAAKENFTPPAVIVVGKVVSLRKKLAWVEQQPLFGKRVVITRARHQAQPLARLVLLLGGEPLLFPTIEIVPPLDFTPMDDAINHIKKYKWIIFTSVNGVEAFFGRMRFLRKDMRALSGIKLCAIGSKTKAELEKFCLTVDYVPQDYTSDAIVEGLRSKLHEGERILLPRVESAPSNLREGLKDTGAFVDEVAAYRTVQPEANIQLVKELFKERKAHILTFTSSSTVTNFTNMMGDVGLDELLSNAVVACIGPITAQTALKKGAPVHVVAKEYTIEGLIAGILEYLTGA